VTVLAEPPTAVYGATTPRLWTRPIVTGPAGPCGCGCALSPRTSRGFEAVVFAHDVLGVTLLPWQRWWLIHALELRPDGRLRFRTVLTLVARQNGKTTLLKIVALWAMYLRRADLVLGAAQALNIARESWQGAVQLAEDVPELADEIVAVRRTNGEQCLTIAGGARYMITAATRGAGRGLSVDLLILDELREQRDWDAWGALSKTTMARPGALTVGISNQGDDGSVVLNTLRTQALAGLDTATDDTLGLFEYSAPDGCALDDVHAWAQANPAMNHPNGVTEAAVRSACTTDPPTTFRTEVLCQRVDVLNAAVDTAAWTAGADPGATLEAVRAQLVACVEVAYDERHVTMCAAAPDGDRVRGEVLAVWESVHDARADLSELCAELRPRALGYFAYGPSAQLGPDLQALHGVSVGRRIYARDEFHPHSPGVVRLTGQDAVTACQTFANLVDGRRFVHPDDELLNAHVAASVRKDQGDGWRFARKGAGRNDAAYAMAGAVHLARTLPAYRPASRPRIY